MLIAHRPTTDQLVAIATNIETGFTTGIDYMVAIRQRTTFEFRQNSKRPAPSTEMAFQVCNPKTGEVDYALTAKRSQSRMMLALVARRPGGDTGSRTASRTTSPAADDHRVLFPR